MDDKTSHGHLSVRVEGAHPDDVRFMFGQQPSRTAWSILASAGFDIALVVLFVLLGRIPHKPAVAPANSVLNDQIVWLVEPGPGGGGGGGGNEMPLPPKPA